MISTDLDIRVLLMQYFCFLFSLSVHEAAHAAMANRCGDPSARLMGRMTLNPLKHIDPMGTVVMPLLMFVTSVPYLFGWAKPVPFNPRNLHNLRRDSMLISLAGPMSNLCIAITAALVVRVLAMSIGFGIPLGTIEALLQIFLYLIVINLILMLFNLIPVPPLDGFGILEYFLPRSIAESISRIGPFGILIAILMISQLGILGPPMRILGLLLSFVAFYGTPVWDMTNAG